MLDRIPHAAWHEADHAVSAVTLDVPIFRVVAHAVGGIVQFPEGVPARMLGSLASSFAYAEIMVAGSAAAAIAGHRGDDGSEVDRYEFDAAARALELHGGPPVSWAEMHDQATHVLRREWSAVESLADVLAGSGVVTGEQALSIVRANLRQPITPQPWGQGAFSPCSVLPADWLAKGVDRILAGTPE
jgi:hypothetical protein